MQVHGPQSTVFLQLFLTKPHLPGQVVLIGLALHFFLRFLRFLPTTGGQAKKPVPSLQTGAGTRIYRK